MRKYAKIADLENKSVIVGLGDPDAVWKVLPPDEEHPEGVTLTVADYYTAECGMELMEVEQAADGRWYLVGHAPAPTFTVDDYDKAMEAHLKAEREARGYTSREPSDYAGSAVPRWAQDAADWIAHRDAVMLYALGVINTYQETGEAPSLDEFKAGLPVIAWTINE